MSRAASLVSALALVASCSGASEGKEDPAVGGETPRPTAAAPTDCKLDAVAALADGLGALDARAQRDVVAKELATACTLPDVIRDFVEHSAQPETTQAGAVAKSPDMAALRKAQSAICPGAGVVFKVVAEASLSDRSNIVFDKCNLDKFGLIGRSEYGRLEGSPTMPFYAFKWMQEQGVPEDQAQPIARALLMMARRDWGHPDIEVVTLAQALKPVPPDARVVHVTDDAILFEGRSVVTLAAGVVDEADMKGLLLGPLYDLLSEEGEKATVQAESKGETFAGDIVFVAGADTSYDTLMALVFTAQRADFNNVSFLAQTAPLDYGVVPIAGPKVGAARAALVARYVVQIEAKGFSVSASDPAKVHIGDGAGTDAWDFAALGKHAAEFRAAHAKADTAYLAGVDSVTLGPILRTIAALRGGDCESSGSCVFARVGLGIGGHGFDPDMMARQVGILGMMEHESGQFLASPYGSAFAADEDLEDPWGGLTGTEVGEAFGVGGLGLVGTSRGGGGTGEGTIGLGNVGLIGKGGGGGTSKKVPRVRHAKAAVKGSLDKDIIRRIVRAHINEVRYCYNKALVKDPALSGRVSIKFTIAGTGSVTESDIASETLSDGAVAKCIAKAVKRWKFPKPSGGGNVVVTYPFVLEPG